MTPTRTRRRAVATAIAACGILAAPLIAHALELAGGLP